MNTKAARTVALEVLDSRIVELVHIEHGLYRIAHVYRDGLTDKEHRFLMARHSAVAAEREKLTKLRDRLRRTP